MASHSMSLSSVRTGLVAIALSVLTPLAVWAQKGPAPAVATAPVPVEANKASQAELEMVKGIGPQLSGQLISVRATQPYKDWSDFIQRTSGVGAKRAAKLSSAGLTVNGTSYNAPATAGAGAPPSPARPVPQVARAASQ